MVVQKKIIKINKNDNVAIALIDLKRSDIFLIDKIKVKIKEDIKKGHKFTLKKVFKDCDIIKYGYPIGKATSNIEPGYHVHKHNLKTNLDKLKDYEFNQKLEKLDCNNRNLSFYGYHRTNGRVGIRNELWVIPTVGCVNKTAERIVQRFKENINEKIEDDVKAFRHDYGCSQYGVDLKTTQRLLKSIILHPNAAGVLVLGLGCEHNQISELKKIMPAYNRDRIKFLIAQEVEDEIDRGVEILKKLYRLSKKDQREKISLSELKIGLKCGGSDGFSGLTANPLIGDYSDFLISRGGTTVMTEVPEMFGSEFLLMERAKDREVFNKIVKMVNSFKSYFIKNDQPVYENPSPGNIRGGITTLEEKSLGCTQKSGKATIVDVINYGDIVKKEGLNLLDCPSNDMVSTTALGAAGCHMVLFSTGRGTPYGSFIPTVKISTNSDIARFKREWIDFDAGEMIIKKPLEELINFIIKVASGEKVLNEVNDYREISIWRIGVTG